ncbi:MAG: hypothetical protein QOJ89_1940 [bacterium]|jgi:hypothetical protein
MPVAMDFVAFGSAVALVLGYVVLFALWWFVFRGRGDE